MAADQAQVVIETTALCRMLIETLEHANNVVVASDQLMVELRELHERARSHLASMGASAL